VIEVARNPFQLTNAEKNYYECLTVSEEMACVGAGVGGGFENTAELHVMKYDTAMKTRDAAQWKKAVEDEHDRMVENDVWTPVNKN
jgi:iron only hydrogenase large subunit-like protein